MLPGLRGGKARRDGAGLVQPGMCQSGGSVSASPAVEWEVWRCQSWWQHPRRARSWNLGFSGRIAAVCIAAKIHALAQPLARKTLAPGMALSQESLDSFLWPRHTSPPQNNLSGVLTYKIQAPNTPLHIPTASAHRPCPSLGSEPPQDGVSGAAQGSVSLCPHRHHIPGSNAGSWGVLACIKPRCVHSCRPHCSHLICCCRPHGPCPHVPNGC